jgi:carboxyl-terminal processing protease
MFRLLLLVLCLTTAPALALAQQSQRAEAGLATFDAVWSTINRKHFDPDFNGVDWKALKKEMRPRAEAADTLDDLRVVIQEMLARLQQSHFLLIEKEALEDPDGINSAKRAGTVGFDFRWREGQAWVTYVEEGGPAAIAGVRPGWILDSIDQVSLDEIVQELPKSKSLREATWIYKELIQQIHGAVESHGKFTFVTDAEGTSLSLDLIRIKQNATVFELPGLPPFFLTIRSRRIEQEGLAIGVVHFSNWFEGIADQLDDALFSMRDCDAIIIDLRGNSGGAGAMARTVGGHFFKESVSLGTQVQRRRKQDYTVVPRNFHNSKRVGVFAGPLAILADETTGSCSEIFAGGMQALGRARIFGERSAGAALPATLTKLPNGDYLLHAIADFLTARGKSLEGDGVQPDEFVPLLRKDLLLGKDAALDAAARWMKAEIER